MIQRPGPMNCKTRSSVNAHSLKKGDVIYRGATPLLVHSHPSLNGNGITLDLQFMENGHTHTETVPKNTPITIVIGAHAGGGGIQ